MHHRGPHARCDPVRGNVVPMRIRAVTTWFPTTRAPSSGAFVEKDVIALMAAGHDVSVIHLVPPHQDDGVQSFDVEGVRVHRVPMATGRPWTIRAASRELRPMLADADVVHTMAFSALLPFVSWRPDAPWVHTEHWSGISVPQTLPTGIRLGMPALRPLLRRPDVVTAVCEYLAGPVRKVRPGPVNIVPCIVEPPSMVVPRRSGRHGSAALDQRASPRRPHELRLVSVGGLTHGKDPLTAVDTLAELRRRGVEASLTWVGDGPLKSAMQDRAKQLGLSELVRLTGEVPPHRVVGELESADLFLLPTRHENFSVSTAEAIVHGRPVVVGAEGGQGEYITQDNGAMVPVREPAQDPVAYADAVERVWASAGSAEAVAATIGNRFSSASVVAGYEQAYTVAGDIFRAGGVQRRG